jgi:hypothetical protein
MINDKGDERIAFSEKNIRFSFVYLNDLNLILSSSFTNKTLKLLYYYHHKNDIYLYIYKYFRTDDRVTNTFSNGNVCRL